MNGTCRLKAALATELPRIEAALAEAVASLPPPVIPVARHILEAGGKRLRPLLTLTFARLFDPAGADCRRLAITLELLHAATLLHDDVLDNALTRRNRAAAHTVFDAAAVILGGDALLSHANAIVAEYGDTRLTRCFSEATSRTAAGEILEIAFRGRTDISTEDYEEMARGKTAWLIRAACLMGALAAGAGDDGLRAAADYGENLGMAFQMVDDALDFAPAEITGKPTGGDVREGKFTPPLRLYRESLDAAERAAFDAAFAGGMMGEAEAAVIAERIRRAGYDNLTRLDAQRCLDRALAALELLPDGPQRSLLREICAAVRERKK
ncbi:MAG: polyprenyl synthetase family protein [Desulfovibrio sp.]|jgi:octaprenyl-diphosphate synthase|nr:polyprenyl synthetase family protein [Desulfovibrio sp.]